jgi:rhodanese-related sulfurtransferase
MKMLDPLLRTPAELPSEASEEPSGYAASTVTPVEAQQMIAAGGITVLDVRDRVSYDSSRIANSICIPYGELIAGNTTSLPEKNTVIIVVCFYGATSEKACEYLSGIGYEYLFSLAGGMDSWTYETVGD